MNSLISKDGTLISYDQGGSGPPVILIGGAFSYRLFPMSVKIGKELSREFTVLNYDRRGRGDSGDKQPYAVDREIEDLESLIDAAGGSAYVWAISSGATLALRAAARGLNIKKLALYQPPFRVDSSGPLPPTDFAAKLDDLIAADRRGEAVEYMMTKGMGAPAIFVKLMRFLPVWSRLKALAHTLPYDVAIMGDTVEGRPLSREPWASVTIPTIVIDGSKSPPRARQGAQAAAEILPNARYHTLQGQGFNVTPEALVPILLEFFNH